MDWIAGNSLYKSSPYTRQQCMQLIFTIHNIEFHTQREITRVYTIAVRNLISSVKLDFCLTNRISSVLDGF